MFYLKIYQDDYAFFIHFLAMKASEIMRWKKSAKLSILPTALFALSRDEKASYRSSECESQVKEIEILAFNTIELLLSLCEKPWELGLWSMCRRGSTDILWTKRPLKKISKFSDFLLWNASERIGWSDVFAIQSWIWTCGINDVDLFLELMPASPCTQFLSTQFTLQQFGLNNCGRSEMLILEMHMLCAMSYISSLSLVPWYPERPKWGRKISRSRRELDILYCFPEEGFSL